MFRIDKWYPNADGDLWHVDKIRKIPNQTILLVHRFQLEEHDIAVLDSEDTAVVLMDDGFTTIYADDKGSSDAE